MIIGAFNALEEKLQETDNCRKYAENMQKIAQDQTFHSVQDLHVLCVGWLEKPTLIFALNLVYHQIRFMLMGCSMGTMESINRIISIEFPFDEDWKLKKWSKASKKFQMDCYCVLAVDG